MSDTILITMKMDGITGESQVEGATGEVDVLNWGYSAVSPMNGRGPGFSDMGAADLGPLVTNKQICGASSQLLSHFFMGKPIPKVVLSEYKSSGDGQPKKALTITLTNVRISSQQMSSGGQESLTLVGDTFEIEIFSQATPSSQLASKGKVTYDLLKKKTQ
jgi:type VI protein secretion system component Hcp